MQFRHLLIKIAQGGYGTGKRLYLIKKKQRFSWRDLLLEKNFKVGTDTRYVKVAIKEFAQGLISLKIDESKRFNSNCFFPNFLSDLIMPEKEGNKNPCNFRWRQSQS